MSDIHPMSGSSYDNLMGNVMDAEDHPASNIPDITPETENNPLNPANEQGMRAMKAFSEYGRKKR